MDVRTQLSEFISNDLLSGIEVADTDDLLVDGVIDSIGMMRLVAFIEESIGVTVPPQDFTIENFGSIRLLGDYVERRRTLASGG